LQGDISPENEQRLAAHVATCPACRAEVDAMTETWESLGSLDDEQVPHERLRARFHAGLAAYEARESRHWTERVFGSWWPQQPALQMGLAAALAFVGVLVGQQLPSARDSEVAALRNEVRAVGIALLDHQSASERLLGVKWAQGTARSPEVVDALLERVQYDSNLSVRLAAVDALRADLDNPSVVARLAMALEQAGIAAAPGCPDGCAALGRPTSHRRSAHLSWANRARPGSARVLADGLERSRCRRHARAEQRSLKENPCNG
jgi:anti-sigma factor RsiW